MVHESHKVTNSSDSWAITNENLRSLVEQKNVAREEERFRIARELHDSTIQSLIAVLHQLERFLDKNQHFDMTYICFLLELNIQIKGIIEEVRHLSFNLRPSILDYFGLLPSIEYLTDGFIKNYGISIKLVVLGTQYRFLTDIELNIFRVIQEALQNIARHAQATSVKIFFDFNQEAAKITIKDNGIGIKDLPDLIKELPCQKKMGLTGMFERIKLIEGKISLASTPWKGTTIKVIIPATVKTTGNK